MARGGKRAGAGRPKGQVLPLNVDREAAGRLLQALNRAPMADDTYEVKEWRHLTEAGDVRIRLDARKYLYDKRDGKAVQPVEMNAQMDHTIIVDIPSAVTRRASERKK